MKTLIATLKTRTVRLLVLIVIGLLAGTASYAQRGQIQNLRHYDKRGINVFETNKENDTTKFDGLKLRIGANFTQGFQSISHSNTSGKGLYKMGAGFPLAQANMNINVQIADGVRVNLVTYMASHHHNETWVKGGYFQIDKVGFMNMEILDRLWKNLSLKIGHMEINYGDAHFRRSDGGNTFWNPYIDNNIMDAFTTEIGAELYWQKKGFLIMGGATNGEIQGSIATPSQRAPSVYGKIGYDAVFAEKTRVRLTGSVLSKSSSINGTLFRGDRTGSNYQFVLEPTAATLTGNAFSGRLNPALTDNVTSYVINPFVKFHGLEVFGTFEFTKGNSAVENGEIQYTPAANDATVFQKLKDRKFNQTSIDALYRFGKNEQFYIGAKYNTVSGTQAFGMKTTVGEAGGISQGTRQDITIERMSYSAGWFVTPNILVKGEYVNQKHKDYPTDDILGGGKFDGFVLQGSIAF